MAPVTALLGGIRSRHWPSASRLSSSGITEIFVSASLPGSSGSLLRRVAKRETVAAVSLLSCFADERLGNDDCPLSIASLPTGAGTARASSAGGFDPVASGD